VSAPPPDTIAPTTAIKRPKPKKNTVTITFSADDPGAAFDCKPDKRPFAPCTSPTKLKKVKAGKHTFLARATDQAGNVGAVAQTSFKIEKKH
jgi:hypothetical protein